VNAIDEIKLCSYAEKVNGDKFSWGTTDCLVLLLGWLEELTGSNQMSEYFQGSGVNPIEDHRNEEEAKEYLETLGDFVSDILASTGFKKYKCFPTVGDILVVGCERLGKRYHICLGATVLAATESHGVIRWPVNLLEGNYEVYRRWLN